MSHPGSLKLTAAEKAVTSLATWIYAREQVKKDSLSAVEKAMDQLSYDGDACVDDIADRVVRHYDNEKKGKNEQRFTTTTEAGREKEDRDLREAQRRMDELAGLTASTTKSSSTFASDDDGDDWDPEPPPVNREWMQTLEVLDALDDRIKVKMTH
jgi:hypothetical protein